ncbi:DUF11 domain-containing protein, partial [Patescibacteria group bacterium]
MRRAVIAFWSTQTVATVLLLALAAANISLFLTATPRPPARALVSSFTEDFTTTTYRDAVNTTGTWLGDGKAYLGTGSASSTHLYTQTPPAGIKAFSAVGCKDANTCYLTTQTNAGITILRTSDAGVSWEQVYSGDLDAGDLSGNAQLDDIFAVPGTDVVYAVGKNTNNNARVLKSSDGGTTWAFAETGFSGSVYLKGISCSDASTCVAVGDNLSTTPRLYYTVNGGTSWAAGTLPAGSYALRDVSYYNDGSSSTWRAVGTAGTILVSAATSSPGGWTAEVSGTGEELRGVAMLGYNSVTVVGGTVHTTSFMASSTNAGTTYATSTHAASFWMHDISCGDADTCWTAGGRDGGGAREIQRTDDAGQTWALVADNTPNNTYLRAVAAVNGSIAYAAGGASTWNLVKTSTSTHFTNINVETFNNPAFPVRSMWQDPSDGQTVYVVGDNGGTGYVGKSTDAGLTWAYATASNPGRINAIDCVSSQICFGAGIFGVLYKTTDGAASWTTQTNSNVFAAHGYGVDAVTSQMAWVTGAQGSDSYARIIRTVDGGTTYTSATGTLSSGFWAYDVWAESTSTAWVAGYDSGTGLQKIYYTSDSGASWTQQYSASAGLLYDLYFLPGNNTGWAIESSGAVLKTTNAGGTWTQVSTFGAGVVGTYSQAWFLNENVGFISGDGCSGAFDKFFTTVNGGTSWTKRNFPCTKGPLSFYQNRGLVGNGDSSTALQIGRIVFAFSTPSVLQSTTIDSTSSDINCAGITPSQTLNGGTVTYQMSNDGGATWTASGGACAGIADTHEFAFASTGSDLRWRATLTGADAITSPAVDSLSVNYVTNTAPNQPVNASPADGATNVLLTPTLTASDFSDPDAGDTHASSRWEVSTTANSFANPVFASTSSINLTSITIPSGTLVNNTTYHWHVKYVDAGGANSAFSTTTSFTTLSSGGSSESTIAKSSPPTSPLAVPEKTERAARSLFWRFQDTASTEQGFSIVDAKDQNKVYVSTNPIFTQDAFELKEVRLSPAAEYCGRAVVAFNDKGNSPITASSTYPCTWTLPDPPAMLEVTSSSPTTITLGGIEKDANPEKVLYKICEVTTGLCLAPGSVVAAAEDGFAAAAQETTYVLSKEGVSQTKEQWGEEIVIVGLQPETTYSFAATAYNPNGDSATGKNEQGETVVVEGQTTAAPVKFSIVKDVAVNPAQAALAGIAFAADFSFAALALMAIAGMAWFLTLHRKSGSIRCVAGLCQIFAHHTRSYMATVVDAEHGPPLSRHARVHRFTQGTLIAALGALAVKGAVIGAALLVPVDVFGQGDFSGDGRPVRPGDTLVYQIILKNAGPNEANSLVLTDDVPSTLTYQAGSLTVDGIKQSDACDNDWICITNNRVTLKLPVPLKVGEAKIVSLAGKVAGKAGETVINTACVTAKELTTPTCAEKTANPIEIAKIVNKNQNANVPQATNVNRQPVNGNVSRPPTTNVNQNQNANVNAPGEEPPVTPPFVEGQQTTIKINQQAASADLVVTDATPELSGSGEPGSLISLRVDGTLVGVAFVAADGTWRFTLHDALPDGPHTVTVALDGVVFDTAQFAVDTVAPPAVSNLEITI